MAASNLDPSNMTYLFSSEKMHDVQAFDDYMRRHWSDSILYSGVYLIVIFGGKYAMEDRERFELRPYLALWSGLLAVFSIFGAMRTAPELYWALSKHGFEYSCCSSSYLDQGKVSSFWTYLFVLSKVFELGDTVFMVLRKQPIIFLHWYHHVTVLLYVWYSYVQKIGTGRYYMVLNFTVHSIMYSYYALRAMKFRLPRWISIFITTLQLLQMLTAIFVILVSYSVLSAGRECVTNYRNIALSLSMYFSYLVLFLQFFYKSYIVKKPQIHDKRQ